MVAPDWKVTEKRKQLHVLEWNILIIYAYSKLTIQGDVWDFFLFPIENQIEVLCHTKRWDKTLLRWWKTMWNSPLSELSFHLLPVITNNDLTRVQSSSLFFAKWIKMTKIISCVMNPVDQGIKRQTDFTYIKLLNDLY